MSAHRRPRVLVVTAQRAEPSVRAALGRLGPGGPRVEVRVAPREVAALLTAEEVEPLVWGEWDLVMLPGLVRGDVAALGRRAGARVVRGPRHAFDLAEALGRLGGLELSPDEPADMLWAEERRERARSVLEAAKRERARGPCYEVRGLRIGRGLPPRVLAEVEDCDALPADEVVSRARRLLSEGAEVVDLGFRAEATAERASELVEAVLPLGAPVSVDSLDASIIDAAVEAGAHMALSLHPRNLEAVRPADAVFVVVPGAGEKVEGVLAAAERARQRGFERLVLDPVLDPPCLGLAGSLEAYARLSRASDLPVLMGVGNATELIDADSPGVNALLCAVAQELGVALLLTVEGSDKTAGAVRECRRARDMALVASRLGGCPKDIGLDLLALKEKRRVRGPLAQAGEAPERPIERSFVPERGVEALVAVTEDDRIQCLVRAGGEERCLLEGTSARAIWSEVLSRRLVRDLGHAAYLGSELARAEEAAASGKGYVQDVPLFTRDGDRVTSGKIQRDRRRT